MGLFLLSTLKYSDQIFENSPNHKLLFSLFHLVLEHSVHLYCSSINQTLQRTTSEFQNIFAALRISVAALWFRYSSSFKNSLIVDYSTFDEISWVVFKRFLVGFLEFQNIVAGLRISVAALCF